MMYVNLWAVVAAAIVSMIIGSIWYGPLFGKMFMKEMGMEKFTKEQQESMKKNMWISYVIQLIASLVMFFVLSGLINGFGHTSLGGGMLVGFIIWLGLVVPVKIGDVIWGGNRNLFWLNIGYFLVLLLATGALLGAWQ